MQRQLSLIIYLNPLGDTHIAVANANNICMRGTALAVRGQLRGPRFLRLKGRRRQSQTGSQGQTQPLQGRGFVSFCIDLYTIM